MPIYEYRCQKCGELTEYVSIKADGGPASVPCGHCGITAVKIVSQVNVGQIASGFKDGPFMMTDPETGNLKPLDKDHTIDGLPREEHSKEEQRLLDIESIKKDDPKRYAYEKGRFHGEILDSMEGGDVNKQELDTYHERPGEDQDELRRASPLDYPITDKDYVKIGEKKVRNKKGKVIGEKPILADKSVIQKKGT